MAERFLIEIQLESSGGDDGPLLAAIKVEWPDADIEDGKVQVWTKVWEDTATEAIGEALARVRQAAVKGGVRPSDWYNARILEGPRPGFTVNGFAPWPS